MARAASLLLTTRKPVIKFPRTRPKRTITAVDKVCRFIRVEPAITSGPTAATIAIEASRETGESGVHVTQIDVAPSSRAYAHAPSA